MSSRTGGAEELASRIPATWAAKRPSTIVELSAPRAAAPASGTLEAPDEPSAAIPEASTADALTYSSNVRARVAAAMSMTGWPSSPGGRASGTVRAARAACAAAALPDRSAAAPAAIATAASDAAASGAAGAAAAADAAPDDTDATTAAFWGGVSPSVTV